MQLLDCPPPDFSLGFTLSRLPFRGFEVLTGLVTLTFGLGYDTSGLGYELQWEGQLHLRNLAPKRGSPDVLSPKTWKLALRDLAI